MAELTRRQKRAAYFNNCAPYTAYSHRHLAEPELRQKRKNNPAWTWKTKRCKWTADMRMSSHNFHWHVVKDYKRSPTELAQVLAWREEKMRQATANGFYVTRGRSAGNSKPRRRRRVISGRNSAAIL